MGRGKNKVLSTIAKLLKEKKGVTETTPSVDTSVGTEGYDDTKATTAVNPLATLRLVRVS